MKTKTIKKNQKPIEIDAHIKYVCPSPGCSFTHWLSLSETQTKDFKVVCECGCIFKPQRIKKLKIIYKNIVSNKNISTDNTDTTKNNTIATDIKPQPKKPEIPIDVLNDCTKILVGYGFTKQESVNLSNKAFLKIEECDSSELVKYILQNLVELESE